MDAILIKEAGGYDLYRIDEDGKRVTFASTQDYKQKLSHKNCQAIELGYDLDELFNKVDSSIDYHEFDFTSFKHGANAILEILGDKKFSEEDIKQAYLIGCDKQTTSSYHVEKNIKSLQQTEWDVVIVTKPFVSVSLIIVDFSEDTPVDVLNVKKEVVEEGYALDEDGCLILKRK